MYFASDNSAGVHPRISESLAHNGSGYASSYGASELDKKVEAKFAEIFETDVYVFFVATGTAANSLALASVSKPGGIAFCHEEAHVIEDECGAPEFYSNSSRLKSVRGENGKISGQALKAEYARFDPDFVHYGRPMATTITQASELGSVYSIDEIGMLADITHSSNAAFHMDGARFSNALVSLDVTPAQMTWKSGVDLLSFGGTKNGCWCAEALICFDKKKAEEISYLRKRAGHLFSKSRFIAAQFDAYLEDNLWLELASHANSMSKKLADGVGQSNFARLAFEQQANECFIIMEPKRAEILRQKGVVFYEWSMPVSHPNVLQGEEKLYRFVTSFQTQEAQVNQLITALSA